MTAPIGTIVEGTLQPREWIEGLRALIDILDTSPETRAELTAQLDQAAVTEDPADIDAVITAIQPTLPPYCILSTHPGDGACLGVWIDWKAVEADMADGTIAHVDHPDHAPPDAPYAIVIGWTRSTAEATLYRRDGSTWTEVWAI